MDGACDTIEVTPDLSTPDPAFDIVFAPDAADPGPIALTVTTSDGTFTAEGTGLDIEIVQPNGRFCEPTCHFAQLEIVNGEIVNGESANQ